MYSIQKDTSLTAFMEVFGFKCKCRAYFLEISENTISVLMINVFTATAKSDRQYMSILKLQFIFSERQN